MLEAILSSLLHHILPRVLNRRRARRLVATRAFPEQAGEPWLAECKNPSDVRLAFPPAGPASAIITHRIFPRTADLGNGEPVLAPPCVYHQPLIASQQVKCVAAVDWNVDEAVPGSRITRKACGSAWRLDDSPAKTARFRFSGPEVQSILLGRSSGKTGKCGACRR